MNPQFFANSNLYGGTSTGNFLIDFLLRPIFRLGFQHPFILVTVLCLIYGFIGYLVLRSAYTEKFYY